MSDQLFDADDLRVVLAALGQDFHARGWMFGTAGNLSARLPDGSLWVTASGVDKGRLRIRDFVRVNVDGELLEAPEGRKPSAETCLHQAVYGWDDAQMACLHVHTVASNMVTRLWTKDVPLPPIEMIKGLGIWYENPKVSVQVYDNPKHVPFIGDAVAARFAVDPPQVPLYLVRDHGITVWGRSLREATNRLECAVYVLEYTLAAVQSGCVWWTDDPRG